MEGAEVERSQPLSLKLCDSCRQYVLGYRGQVDGCVALLVQVDVCSIRHVSRSHFLVGVCR